MVPTETVTGKGGITFCIKREVKERIQNYNVL